jgi:hypothetical protein
MPRPDVRPKVIDRLFCGKRFRCLDDQSAPDKDIAALEKRTCNQIIAKHCYFWSGIDAFAGVGISSYIWARCNRHLCIVENREDAIALLTSNLKHIRCRSCVLQLAATKADTFLRAAAAAGLSYDFVDLDPFGNCFDLLPLVSQLVPKGVICVTSGEIYQVYRGLNRRNRRTTPAKYRGRGVRRWLIEEYLPEILNLLPGSELVHFYAYPTSVRAILRTGRYRIYSEWFKARPNFLSWLA